MNNQQTDQYIQLEAAFLTNYMHTFFARLDVAEDERTILVDTLMEASLAGYNSHGIMRLPMYAKGIRQGYIRLGAKIQVRQETAATAYVDGGWGLGPVTATAAMEMACQKATQVGIGCVSVVNSNDIARLGSYVIKPAQQGLVALLMVNDAGGGPCVVPWGGVQPFLSTNPLAAGIPWQGDQPMIIDVSTSVVSLGQLKTMNATEKTPPAGLLIDKAGQPTQDLAGFFAEAKESMLLPLGGLVAGHKGFALSLLVDILAGALSGAGCSTGQETDLDRNGLFMVVIDPAMFVTREAFNQSVERFLAGIKASQPAPYVDEIVIPGERAAKEKARRLSQGIPIEKAVWVEIEEINKGLCDQ